MLISIPGFNANETIIPKKVHSGLSFGKKKNKHSQLFIKEYLKAENQNVASIHHQENPKSSIKLTKFQLPQ